jgi:two-component system response regulator
MMQVSWRNDRNDSATFFIRYRYRILSRQRIMMVEEMQHVDILMVEDDPVDAELALRSLRGNDLAERVRVIEDGVTALDFLFCRGPYAGRSGFVQPRVVLLDLKLPFLGGLDVLRQIKSDERTRAIPVVVLTSSHEDSDIRTAYALGANGYVVKPVDFDAFSTAMSRLGLYWVTTNQPPSVGDEAREGA